MVARIGISPHPMFRPVKGDEIHFGGVKKDVDGGAEIPVHAGGIRHQTHTLAFEVFEVIAFQHVDAGIHDQEGEKEKNSMHDQLF